MKFVTYRRELKELLESDQRDKRATARRYFNDPGSWRDASNTVKKRLLAVQRSKRLAHILADIVEPRISFIGIEGVEALAVLALHADSRLIHQTIAAFKRLEAVDPADTDLSLLPALFDYEAVLHREPQIFGSIWFFDAHRWPHLYETRNRDDVDKRRLGYGLEPLRWPKSMAIPAGRQPWLQRPFSEHGMRSPTDVEYEDLVLDQTQEIGNVSAAA